MNYLSKKAKPILDTLITSLAISKPDHIVINNIINNILNKGPIYDW